jgi:hypothetical protein
MHLSQLSQHELFLINFFLNIFTTFIALDQAGKTTKDQMQSTDRLFKVTKQGFDLKFENQFPQSLEMDTE